MSNHYNLRKQLFILFTVLSFTAIPKIHAQWVSCNAPLGGDITSMDTFSTYLFASLQDGGIYRSADNGQNWTAVNTGLKTNYYSGVLSLIHIPGKIFAATKNGLYASFDFGDHWDSVALGQTVYSLAQQGSYLYATEYGDVARSNDNGVTWQMLTNGLPPEFTYTPYRIASVQNTLVLSTIGFGMFSSVDNGDTWTALATPPGVPSTTFPSFIKVIDNRLFVVFSNYGFYSSDNAGTTWQSDMTSNGGTLNMTGLVIANGLYIASTTEGLWTVPVSGGLAWTPAPMNLPLPYPIMNNIIKTAAGLYMGTADGPYMADTMLASAQLMQAGMVGTNVHFLDGFSSFDSRVIADVNYQRKIWSSLNSGVNWETDSFTNYTGTQLESSAKTGPKWYISLGGGINYSYDAGFSWSYILGTGLPRTYSGIMATTLGAIFAGSDSGNIYQVVNDESINFYTHAFNNDDMVSGLLEAGSFWFATTSGTGTPQVYRSANNGTSWQNISAGWGTPSQLADGLVYQDNRLIAVSDGDGAFTSTDFGDTWHQLSTGLPPSAGFTNVKLLNNKVYAVASNYEQLYSLGSGDTAWACENCTPYDPQRAASIYASDTVLYLGTANKGVWRKSTALPNSVNSITKATLTASCFPNPGTTTTIQISDANVTYPVTINIRSIDGKLCSKSITNTNTYKINQPGLPAGAYIIELLDNKGAHSFLKWTKIAQ